MLWFIKSNLTLKGSKSISPYLYCGSSRGHIPLSVCTRSPLTPLSGNSGAVTPLPQICEWAANGKCGSKRLSGLAVRKYPLMLTSCCWGEIGRQVSDLWPHLPRCSAWRARNVSTPLSQPRHGEWKTRTKSTAKRSVCAGSGASVVVYILQCCANVGESVLGAGVMDDLMRRDTGRGAGGVCVGKRAVW